MVAYRSDIDGLRAIAVGAVVLYHAGVPGFSGGFVGVDVFFVISGYLITSILLDDLHGNRFSVANFYERRIRRIFPALFTMMAACAVFGWWLLLPGEFADFGESAVAATLFVSNIYFNQTADYFGTHAHLKPLLHTWSLSVEEQFYLAFPLLLWLVARKGGGRWLLWLVPLLLLSLAVAVWGAYARPQGTFYLAPTRAWELLIGAVLATGSLPAARERWVRETTGLAGLAAISIAVVLYGESTIFPGAAALLPCVGTALVIYSGQSCPSGSRGTLVGSLLGTRPFVMLGLVSYSLYLWHWPFLVFARIHHGSALGPQETALAVSAALAASFVSWRFVEQPFRRPSTLTPRPLIFSAAVGVMALTIGAGAMASIYGGWTSRFPGYARPEIAGRHDMQEGRCFLTPKQAVTAHAGPEACTFGEAGAPRVVVWGDSFAAHLMSGLKGSGALQVTQLTSSACPPVLGFLQPRRANCEPFNREVFRWLSSARPRLVVLSARWESYIDRWISPQDIQNTIDRLNQLGIAVVLVGQSPSFDFDSPYDAAFRTGRNVGPVNFDLGLNSRLAALGRVSFLDPMPLFCSGAVCVLEDAGEFLFFDGGHFSVIGSRRLSDRLVPVIRQALQARPEAASSSGR